MGETHSTDEIFSPIFSLFFITQYSFHMPFNLWFTHVFSLVLSAPCSTAADSSMYITHVPGRFLLQMPNLKQPPPPPPPPDYTQEGREPGSNQGRLGLTNLFYQLPPPYSYVRGFYGNLISICEITQLKWHIERQRIR